MRTSFEISHSGVPGNSIDDKSALIQVIIWFVKQQAATWADVDPDLPIILNVKRITAENLKTQYIYSNDYEKMTAHTRGVSTVRSTLTVLIVLNWGVMLARAHCLGRGQDF